MPETQTENALYFDNTRVSTFFKCPRSYYFRHIRHWRREGVRIPLVFGGAMHSAMEVLWAEIKNVKDDMQLLRLCMRAFYEKWIEEGLDPDNIDMSEKRNPGLAMEILAEYISKYREWFNKIEVLAIEQPFIIPLTVIHEPGENDRIEDVYVHYIGRWDKVWRERNGDVFVGEHKTTSLYRKSGIFAREWLESFSPDSQVDGYSYAAHSVYGEACRGVIVDGLMVHKTVRGFTRIPIQRAMSKLDAWFWNTRYWINEIVDNTKMLSTVEEAMSEAPETEDNDVDFLPAFPQRTEHCQHKYGSCAYLNICKYEDANPERILIVPQGFIEEIWDPFAHNVEEGQKPMMVGDGIQLDATQE